MTTPSIGVDVHKTRTPPSHNRNPVADLRAAIHIVEIRELSGKLGSTTASQRYGRRARSHGASVVHGAVGVSGVAEVGFDVEDSNGVDVAVEDGGHGLRDVSAGGSDASDSPPAVG